MTTAKADIRSIWSYIAADNAEAADRVEEAISGEGSITRTLAQGPNQVASSILDSGSLSQIRDLSTIRQTSL